MCDERMRSTRRFSLDARAEGCFVWEGAAQRTASMPRGLAAAFIAFAFIVFLWCSKQGLLPPVAAVRGDSDFTD